MTTKPFDCIEMVEQTQADIQQKLEAMTREEQLAFWQTETLKLRERQRQSTPNSSIEQTIAPSPIIEPVSG
jgi:hypothetical protein